jgi:hypothetical protein
MFQKDSALAEVVSAAHRECPWHPQDHDHGAGAKAADRIVAPVTTGVVPEGLRPTA